MAYYRAFLEQPKKSIRTIFEKIIVGVFGHFLHDAFVMF